jgi:hypothetical protein
MALSGGFAVALAVGIFVVALAVMVLCWRVIRERAEFDGEIRAGPLRIRVRARLPDPKSEPEADKSEDDPPAR